MNALNEQDISHCWIKIKVNASHYHYKCAKCGAISKYRRTPFCPMCGIKKFDDIVLNELGGVEWRYSKCLQ